MEKKMMLTLTKLWCVRAYNVCDAGTMFEHEEESFNISTRYFTSEEDAKSFVEKHQDDCGCDVRLTVSADPDECYVNDKGEIFVYDGYILEHGKDDFKEEQETIDRLFYGDYDEED